MVAVLDKQVADRLRAWYRFYDRYQATGEVRWICPIDTTEAEVDTFVCARKQELAR